MPTCPALCFLPAATRSNPCDHSQVYHFSLALWAAFGAIKEFLAIVEPMMDGCLTAECLPELPITDMSWIVMTQNKTPLAAHTFVFNGGPLSLPDPIKFQHQKKKSAPDVKSLLVFHSEIVVGYLYKVHGLCKVFNSID